MKARITANSLARWSIILSANVGAVVYIIVRYYDRSPTRSLFALAVFVIGWLCSWFFTRIILSKDMSPVRILLATLTAIPCCILGGTALERRFLSDLVALQSIDRNLPGYYVWSPRGERAGAPMSLPFERFHRKGDETAHLAAAAALRATRGDPSGIAEMARAGEGHDRSYWIKRALAGHPPGLAALFAPVSQSPPVARVWAILFFLGAACLAYWAGNVWSSGSRFGLLAAACFTFLPSLNWWHMTSVTSDVPPAVFTFLAFGIAGYAACRRSIVRPGLLFPVIGVLFALGTFVTYTGALAALGTAILVWAHIPKENRKVAIWAWLLVPSACAVLMGTLYSRLAIPNSRSVLIARIDSLNEMTDSIFADPIGGIVTFISRWPMDLGIPITIFLSVIPVWFLVRNSDNVAKKLLHIAAALAVLIPASSFFWPEIRFAYPGLLVVLVGGGFKQFWENISNFQKSFMVCSIVAFGFSKYTLHSLFIATAAL